MPQLTIIDVGHGNCAVLQDTNGTVIVDTGPGNALLIFLEESGIQHVDVILISHADQDHIAGLIGLLASNQISINRVRLNTDSLKGTDIWDDLVFELDAQDRQGKIDYLPALTSNSREDYSMGEIAIEVLAPSKYLASKGPGSEDRDDKEISSNAISAAIRMTKNDHPVIIFPGDMDEVGLEGLLANETLEAEILVFPHHGGIIGRDLTDLTQKLCSAVNPKIVIFSIGRGLNGTPRPDIINAITERHSAAWIVCTQLSEHCVSQLPTDEPSHLTEAFAAGRQGRRCCCGTIIIKLDQDPIQITPSQDTHLDFLRQHVPNAICLPSEAE